MDEELKSRLDKKLFDIDPGLTALCKRKKIEIVDKDTFSLNNRGLILNYHMLLGNYEGFLKNIFKGKLVLNEEQLDEYQRKYFVKRNGKLSEEAYLYSDSCDGILCTDLEP